MNHMDYGRRKNLNLGPVLRLPLPRDNALRREPRHGGVGESDVCFALSTNRNASRSQLVYVKINLRYVTLDLPSRLVLGFPKSLPTALGPQSCMDDPQGMSTFLATLVVLRCFWPQAQRSALQLKIRRHASLVVSLP